MFSFNIFRAIRKEYLGHFICTRISLCMRSTNEGGRYIVTSSLIGWVHAQSDPLYTSFWSGDSPSHAVVALLPGSRGFMCVYSMLAVIYNTDCQADMLSLCHIIHTNLHDTHVACHSCWYKLIITTYIYIYIYIYMWMRYSDVTGALPGLK